MRYSSGDGANARLIYSHLTGAASREVEVQLSNDPQDPKRVAEVLLNIFGIPETLASLQQAFYLKIQQDGEILAEFSRELMVMYDRILGIAAVDQKKSLQGVREQALIEQFVAGVRDRFVRQDDREGRPGSPGSGIFKISRRNVAIAQKE